MAKKSSLRDYLKKRPFRKSPEPKGGGKRPSSTGPIFVIQKHDGRHWDERL